MPTQKEWKACALTGYAPRRATGKPLAIVDIETDGLGGAFLLGGYCGEDDPTRVTFFHSLETWVHAFFSKRFRGHIWYAHNGGEYDYKYLLRALCKLYPDIPIRLITQGSSGRVIGAKFRYRKRVYELRDSWALAPVSLAKLSEAFAPHFKKRELDFDRERFQPDNPTHREYLYRDCVGLLASLLRLRADIWDVFGVPMAWTAGATALKAWRRTFAPGMIYWRGSAEREAFCREAYHGGLVTLSRATPQEDVLDIDVNAMYAFAMRQGVPCGASFWTRGEVPDCPGIYRCRVAVPLNIPFTFLPYRHPQHHILCWPTGEFETTLTSIEIMEARRWGVDVCIREGVCFEQIAHPFADFIDRCEELEMSAPAEGGAIKLIAKLLRNALYGKFGAHAETKQFAYLEEGEPPGEGWGPVLEQSTGIPSGLWARNELLNAPYLHPEWAAWITARARITLARFVATCGPSMCYYTDTDSLMVSARAPGLAAIPFGARYGEVKRVHEFAWFLAGGPKNYIGQRTDGSYVSCLKGIPRRAFTPEQHIRALCGEEIAIPFASMNATRFVLAGSRDFMEERVRRISRLENSRGWRRFADGRVRPVHITRRGT